MSSFAYYWYRLLAYINFQQYVSVIVQYQIVIIMGRSQHFPVPDLSPFLFPSPSLLRSGPLIQLSEERRKLNGGGAQTDNALCTRKTSYRSRVSNTSCVFNIEARDKFYGKM